MGAPSCLSPPHWDSAPGGQCGSPLVGPPTSESFLQHLGPNRDQILRSEAPPLEEVLKHRTRTEAGCPSPHPEGFPLSEQSCVSCGWPGWQGGNGPLWSVRRSCRAATTDGLTTNSLHHKKDEASAGQGEHPIGKGSSGLPTEALQPQQGLWPQDA